ncbi:hypothetical protein Tco_1463973, partial [Tanacetum coccineum]
RVSHGGCGLAKGSLLISAHDEYFRKRGCIRGPTDDANFGQSETFVGQGSACNRDCGHRLPSARVLRKCLICVRLEVSGPQPAYLGLSGSSYVLSCWA